MGKESKHPGADYKVFSDGKVCQVLGRLKGTKAWRVQTEFAPKHRWVAGYWTMYYTETVRKCDRRVKTPIISHETTIHDWKLWTTEVKELMHLSIHMAQAPSHICFTPRLYLRWSDYKSDHGSLSVVWPGGFKIYVDRVDCDATRSNAPQTPLSNRTIPWCVKWHEGTKAMPGLTDRKFMTREMAQFAVEAVFIPLTTIVKGMVSASQPEIVGLRI